MSAPRLMTYNGETLSLSAWARRLGFQNAASLHRRFTEGWTVERALTEPAHEKRMKSTGNGRKAFMMAMDGALSADEYLAMDFGDDE